jgi:hypothetical protein
MQDEDWGYNKEGGGWLKLTPGMLHNVLLPKLKEYVSSIYGSAIHDEDSEQVRAMKEVLGDEGIYNDLVKQDMKGAVKLLAYKRGDMEVVEEFESSVEGKEKAIHKDKKSGYKDVIESKANNERTWAEDVNNISAQFNGTYLG